MSFYPTDYTYDDKPTCPNCGYEWTDESEIVDYSDGATTPLECPDCDLRLECTTNVSYNFQIDHPSQCVVRGYHVPFVTDKSHKCLYCSEPLTCDCTLHDHCKHNLEVKV